MYHVHGKNREPLRSVRPASKAAIARSQPAGEVSLFLGCGLSKLMGQRAGVCPPRFDGARRFWGCQKAIGGRFVARATWYDLCKLQFRFARSDPVAGLSSGTDAIIALRLVGAPHTASAISDVQKLGRTCPSGKLLIILACQS